MTVRTGTAYRHLFPSQEKKELFLMYSVAD